MSGYVWRGTPPPLPKRATFVPKAAARPTLQRDKAVLTARECDVLALVVRGLGNADIGFGLFISEDTVKSHMRRIMTRLGCHSRTATATKAVREGLVTASPPATTPLVSDRELDVLQLLADGLSNVEIGDQLGLSPLTVKSHLGRLSRRFETGDRTSIAVRAITSGLIP